MGSKISNFELIEDAGDFSPDESVNWAAIIDNVWYIGDRPKMKKGNPINPPEWATHIMWSEE